MAAPTTTIVVFVCQAETLQNMSVLSTALAAAADTVRILAPAPPAAADAAAPSAAPAASAEPAAPATASAEPVAAPAAPDAAPTCAGPNCSTSITANCSALATEKYIQLAPADATFSEVIKLLKLSAYDYGSSNYGLILGPRSDARYKRFHQGENVLGIFWSRQIAEDFDFRSTFGYLVTTEARIFDVQNNGDGTVAANILLYPGVGPCPRDELFAVVKPLTDCKSDLLTYSSVIDNIKKLKADYDALVSPQTEAPANSQNIFAKLSDEFSLAHNGTALYGFNGSSAFMVMMQPHEFPYTRVRKSGPKHLIVTNFARLIWCENGDTARCLDYPFGDARLVCVATLNTLISQYLTGPAGWSGVEGFCTALLTELLRR